MPQPRKYASSAARQAAYRKRDRLSQQEHLQRQGLPPMPRIASMPGTPRWNAALTSAHQLVACVCEEMQDYYGDRSEAWQESERGEAFEERRGEIEEMLSQMEPLLG
jgi:hypothetical protein